MKRCNVLIFKLYLFTLKYFSKTTASLPRPGVSKHDVSSGEAPVNADDMPTGPYRIDILRRHMMTTAVNFFIGKVPLAKVLCKSSKNFLDNSHEQ